MSLGRLTVMVTAISRPARPFTYTDLEEMPDDGYRREIIGGSLVVSPAPAGGHQLALIALAVLLRAAQTPGTMALVAPYDWKLPSGDCVEPDLVVIRRPDFDADGPLGAGAVPLLVVEILSPSNADQDRLLKRALYESLGVPAYWLVDPRVPSTLALRLRGGHYQTEGEVAGDEVLVTDWPFPIQVVPADLTR